MATRSTDSETTNQTGSDSDKARHTLAIVFSVGRLIRPPELASRCTSFSISSELIHCLCSIPELPLSLTEDLYSARSSDALKPFADSTANSKSRRNEESTNLMGQKHGNRGHRAESSIVVVGFYSVLGLEVRETMAAPIAGRSTVVVCTLFRATTTNPTASASRPSSSPLSSIRSAFRPLQSRVSSPPSRLVRRELASLRPIHTAIASACLVSKLPADPTIYIEAPPRLLYSSFNV